MGLRWQPIFFWIQEENLISNVLIKSTQWPRPFMILLTLAGILKQEVALDWLSQPNPSTNSELLSRIRSGHMSQPKIGGASCRPSRLNSLACYNRSF